jgi:hypothetical protein
MFAGRVVTLAGLTISLSISLSLSVDPVRATIPPPVAPPVSVPSTTIPAGCELPTPVQATFVGRLAATDRRTGRFEVAQIRGGSLDGFAVNGLVDVDYGDDIRFLESGAEYLVAVGVDTASGRLQSKVRDPEPLFGGNQVIGIEERPLDCPAVEDAVRTLLTDGSSVESGVLAPLSSDRSGLLRAVLMPAVWVFGGLVALAVWANAVRALGRRVKASWNGESVSATDAISRRGAPPRREPADR